ncbi:uncharacterized protein LTR77_010213 [Saxophila tyrrhenica]|uniref:WW domain-containing oxidoreductase n=1 Tax=Saxophila tyrrhenica TaxID=1690608 RepID=A0AAV9NW85_9PEZI|nr:hypothetical protein LTR77_010213 [Saxophila tyrrhenica]
MTSPYAAAHANPQGAGDARPTGSQIIENQGLRGKLNGKVMVLTGATSGIGLETARALSMTGATLFLTARNLPAAEKAIQDILVLGRISLIRMDNNSLTSVRAAATEILTRSNGKVNILVANAGVMGISDHQLTEDNHEVHFQTNFLSHFMLFQLLKDALLSSATSDFHSRVVVVASSAHRAATLPKSDDYSFEKSEYDHNMAYAGSNLAKIYLANEVNRRYSSQGLFATSLHPGAINTNISRNIGPEFVQQILANPDVVKVLKSPEQGAATTVLAAVGREWESRGGVYLEDCAEAKRGVDDGQVFGSGWVEQTFNPEAEGRLWRDALELVYFKVGA